MIENRAVYCIRTDGEACVPCCQVTTLCSRRVPSLPTAPISGLCDSQISREKIHASQRNANRSSTNKPLIASVPLK